MRDIQETRTGDVYRKAVALMHLLAFGPSLASLLPGLLPSVPSARLRFSCVLQPKWFSFSGWIFSRADRLSRTL
jgi:hypothetical protein